MRRQLMLGRPCVQLMMSLITCGAILGPEKLRSARTGVLLMSLCSLLSLVMSGPPLLGTASLDLYLHPDEQLSILLAYLRFIWRRMTLCVCTVLLMWLSTRRVTLVLKGLVPTHGPNLRRH